MVTFWWVHARACSPSSRCWRRREEEEDEKEEETEEEEEEEEEEKGLFNARIKVYSKLSQ